MAERSAQVTWQGDLMSGNGEIHEAPSGAFGPLQITWASRSEDEHGGKTSPEELMAAAHASCFSMALSLGLAKAGTPPERLETSATSPASTSSRSGPLPTPRRTAAPCPARSRGTSS